VEGDAMNVLKAAPVYKSALGLSISFMGASRHMKNPFNTENKGRVIKFKKENGLPYTGNIQKRSTFQIDMTIQAGGPDF